MKLSEQTKAVLVSLAVAPLVAVSSLVVWMFDASDRRLYASPAYTVAVLVVLLGCYLVASVREPRVAAATATGALAWTSIAAFEASSEMHRTLTSLPDHGMKCGTGLMMLYLFGVPIGGLVLLGVHAALGHFGAVRGFDGLVRWTARAATLGAFVLASLAMLTWRRPDADTYLVHLESDVTVGTLSEASSVVFGGRELRIVREKRGEPTSLVCVVEGIDQRPVVAYLPTTILNGDDTPAYDPSATACPTYRVTTDSHRDIGILAPEPGESWSGPIAFRAKGPAVELTIPMFADRVAAPLGWRVSAGFGALAGLVLLFASAAVGRRAARLSGLEAMHRGGGLVDLANGERATCSAATFLAPGPVVLFGTERESGYRSAARQIDARALPGTLASLRENDVARAAALAAIALAVVVAATLPLLMSRLAGV